MSEKDEREKELDCIKLFKMIRWVGWGQCFACLFSFLLYVTIIVCWKVLDKDLILCLVRFWKVNTRKCWKVLSLFTNFFFFFLLLSICQPSIILEFCLYCDHSQHIFSFKLLIQFVTCNPIQTAFLPTLCWWGGCWENQQNWKQEPSKGRWNSLVTSTAT